MNDESPLDGGWVDTGVRAGWVLRMARHRFTGAPMSLDTLARELGTSAARLHRLETGQLRAGRLVDGYEHVLGCRPGSLRGPVDVLYRTFPDGPADRDPGPPATTVREMSELTELVAATDVTGGVWLRWARSLAQAGGIGMPESLAEALVERLVDELNRVVGVDYPSRYEALACLREGPYGDVVFEVVRRLVSDPHVQVLGDVMSAFGETVTPRAVAWCVDLLDDERPHVVQAAVLALENMAQISGDLSFWDPLVEPLARRFDAAEPETDSWRWLSHLLRLVPRSEQLRYRLRLGQPLAPPARIENWTRTRLNSHWADCEERARSVTAARGLRDQPMLARFVFDLAISPYESRAVTSYMLLGALPDIAVLVDEQLADLAQRHADPVIRDRVGRRLAGSLHGTLPPTAEAWLTEADLVRRDQALRLAGTAGLRVPERLLTAALVDGPASRRAALYSAGMSAHPLLETWRSHDDEDIAGGAGWWIRHGGRVADVPTPVD